MRDVDVRALIVVGMSWRVQSQAGHIPAQEAWFFEEKSHVFG
jgi:hypothetical protein